tara:strand:+ start:3903 stop:4529 length:627 start_codon:yes stop_codon:yes gene_type:complete
MYHPRVKMCGMTRECDIRHAIECQTDAIGLILYPHSPRGLTLEQAVNILPKLPAFITLTVVMVNPNAIDVWQVLEYLPAHVIQFHGEEDADFCAQFKVPYIKALPAISRDFILKKSSEYYSAQALLLDTPSLDKKGGTGQTFDWSIIPPLAQPLVLAGGINEANVTGAIQRVKPYALDLSSSIEISPGIKDKTKMLKIMSKIKPTAVM